MSSKRETDDKAIPEVIHDARNGCSYIKGRFFGKGGFAKCFELTKMSTHEVLAGKIVSKKMLMRSNQKSKMMQEIDIHQGLKHKHVVGFHGFFDDSDFVYIILELCKKRSMMELHKRRKALTEPEVRYFMRQLLEGVAYLHSVKIVHRDLKLGNVFLNDHLEVKIGDFGLAAIIEHQGQRKKTLCGTPNYIAPEILTKAGHSFEVDVWSLGCIMYTLMVGTPPFETSTLRETYNKIKKCDYTLPKNLPTSGATMIFNMLKPNPSERPSIKSLQDMDFIKNGYCPKELPGSCLIVAPRFDTVPESQPPFRKPLSAINRATEEIIGSTKKAARASIAHGSGVAAPMASAISTQCKTFLITLHSLLYKLLSHNIHLIDVSHDQYLEEISDPGSQPLVWVSKWVDYSDKYGFGYQLVDDGVGVMFNDSTRLVLHANQRNVHYIERDGSETYFIMNSTPPDLDKKMKLLTYFRRYMTEHLMKAGGLVPLQESDSLSRIPYLHMWHRSSSAVLMQLTNGTLQINFMDHTKVIMCPLMEAVTFIDEDKKFRTFKFSTIAEKGCTTGLKVCIDYALRKVSSLLDK